MDVDAQVSAAAPGPNAATASAPLVPPHKAYKRLGAFAVRCYNKPCTCCMPYVHPVTHQVFSPPCDSYEIAVDFFGLPASATTNQSLCNQFKAILTNSQGAFFPIKRGSAASKEVMDYRFAHGIPVPARVRHFNVAIRADHIPPTAMPILAFLLYHNLPIWRTIYRDERIPSPGSPVLDSFMKFTLFVRRAAQYRGFLTDDTVMFQFPWQTLNSIYAGLGPFKAGLSKPAGPNLKPARPMHIDLTPYGYPDDWDWEEFERFILEEHNTVDGANVEGYVGSSDDTLLCGGRFVPRPGEAPEPISEEAADQGEGVQVAQAVQEDEGEDPLSDLFGPLNLAG